MGRQTAGLKSRRGNGPGLCGLTPRLLHPPAKGALQRGGRRALGRLTLPGPQDHPPEETTKIAPRRQRTLPPIWLSRTVGLRVAHRQSGQALWRPRGAPPARAFGSPPCAKRDGKTPPVRQIPHERLLASARSLLRAVSLRWPLFWRQALSRSLICRTNTAIDRILRGTALCRNLMCQPSVK
jgi:hypothetical protein